MKRVKTTLRRLARAATGKGSRSWLARSLAVALIAALGPQLVLWAGSLFVALPERPVVDPKQETCVVLDRGGHALKESVGEEGIRTNWVAPDELGLVWQRALMAAEDKRFYSHDGVDTLALVRASVDSARAGHIVSGASTLTMQLARLIEPHPRTLGGKLLEIFRARRMERAWSKLEIINYYSNLAYFGRGIRGVGAASRIYFGKRPDELSWGEAALIAGLAQSPTSNDPRRAPKRALGRRDLVLGRLRDAGAIDHRTWQAAVAEPLALREKDDASLAEHLAIAARRGRLPGAPAIEPGAECTLETTIDGALESEIQTSVRALVQGVRDCHVSAASVLVVDNRTGDILAYVGSHDFGDAVAGGQNDGVRAKRQPGSTLKPFVYGLAIDEMGYDANTVLPDRELHLTLPSGPYVPHNFDGRYHGDVTLREALANSYNVPAVWTADRLGPAQVLRQLRRAGFESLDDDAIHYGPAIALGDGEVTLIELVRAYAAIAEGGVLRDVRLSTHAARGPSRRIMSEHAASTLTAILSDPRARVPAFGWRSPLELPFDVAAKTGTSKGFRDNWTVGFTREVTVSVWVGNFDGSPMHDVSGVSGAGPIFQAAMLAAERARPVRVPLRSLTADGAPSAAAIAAPRAPAARGPSILSPRPGSRFVVVSDRPASGQALRFVARAPGDAGPLAFYVDGRRVGASARGRLDWALERGEHVVVARDRQGRASEPVPFVVN